MAHFAASLHHFQGLLQVFRIPQVAAIKAAPLYKTGIPVVVGNRVVQALGNFPVKRFLLLLGIFQETLLLHS